MKRVVAGIIFAYILTAANAAFAAGSVDQTMPPYAGLNPKITLSGGTVHAEAIFSEDGTQLYAASATSTDGTYGLLSLPPDVWGRPGPNELPAGTYRVIDLTDGTTINIHNCFRDDPYEKCRWNVSYVSNTWTMTLVPQPSQLAIELVAALFLVGALTLIAEGLRGERKET